MKRVSMADIAAHLGISLSAVSFALNGRPGVSAKLRAQIIAYADKVGYQPNTVAQELMSLVRASREKSAPDVIAFINTFTDPTILTRIEGFRQFLEGARSRARDYGYKLEEFRIHTPGMTPARLAGILRSRGVRGVLLGPRWQNETPIELDWKEFSAVLVGEVFYGPNISRVCNDHVHATERTLERLAELGYKRIGISLIEVDESTRRFDYLLGVDQFRRLHGRSPRISTFLYRDFDPVALEAWIRKECLDALVSLAPEPWQVASRLIASDGRPLGYANLSVKPGYAWAGIEQHFGEVAATAMDLLRAQMLAGQRGTQPLTKILLVRGDWVDGPSAPPRG